MSKTNETRNLLKKWFKKNGERHLGTVNCYGFFHEVPVPEELKREKLHINNSKKMIQNMK